MDVNRVEEVNELRTRIGMEKVNTKTRNCLRCSKSFLSYGPQHRMCDNCRLMNKTDFESDY